MNNRVLIILNIIIMFFAVLAGAFYALSPVFILARNSLLIGLLPFLMCFFVSIAVSLVVQKKLSAALVLPSIYTFSLGGWFGIALVITQSISFEQGFEFTIYHFIGLIFSIISCLVPKVVVHLTKPLKGT